MRRYRKLRVSWVDTVSHVYLGRNYRRLIGLLDSLRAVKPVESPNSLYRAVAVRGFPR